MQINHHCTAHLPSRASRSDGNGLRQLFAAIAALALWLAQPCLAGTWTPLTHAAPGQVGHMLLLSDGTVMAENNNDGGLYGPTWYKLTPDASGSYVNGTWTTLASMINTRLFFASQILKDGRVFVAGGEYGTGGAAGETYDPTTNVWTAAPTAGHTFSDANSEILPDGRVLVALVEGTLRGTLIYNPTTNIWTTGPTCNGIHNESAWVKLPDDSILFVDRLSTNCERYIPAQNIWLADATVPVALYDSLGDECGPAMLLPNGKAIFFGATGHTAIYTPSGNTTNGFWTTGPDFPSGQGQPDAPCAMMPNGKILLAVSPVPISGNVFQSPTSFYEYDYVANNYTQVNAPAGGTTEGGSCFQRDMLLLPDGTVLSSRFATQLYVYSGGGTPLAAGKPTITSITRNGDGSFHLVGTKLNGISEGACYGDDNQDATNYPIVRLTSGSNVYYARTYNWSRTSVSTGSASVTTEFTLPANFPPGNYSLVVVANGIASDPVSFAPTAPPIGVFVNAGPLNGARDSQATVLLGNGKVLAAGGQLNATAVITCELYDPATGLWTNTGSLNTARYDATGTLLPNGKVLVAGSFGGAALASAEIYDPATGVWTTTGPLNTARYAHTAVLLANGQVLVAGGIGTAALASAELYDPVAGTWTVVTNPLHTARYFAAAALLPGGKVLVAGGRGTGAANSSEIYDPLAGTWTPTSGTMTASRSSYTLTVLPNGNVLAAGGFNGIGVVMTAELFNPTLGTWAATGSRHTVREYHTATLLPNGKVLAAAGNISSTTGTTTAELYDYTTGAWTVIGSLNAVHAHHAAVVLPGGKLLIVGGAGTITEYYDPTVATWTTGAILPSARVSHTATLMPNGNVLVAGGTTQDPLGTACVYDAVAMAWNTTGLLGTPRYNHTATLLPNGKILVAGGSAQSNGARLPSAELYDPASGAWSPTGSLAAPRSSHTATLLASGKVLAAGGDNGAPLSTSEIYDPASGAWSTSVQMLAIRSEHTAALLPGGKVLVAGGIGSGGPMNSAEIYDPANSTWTATGSTTYPHQDAETLLLPTGNVLLAGDASSSVATAEIYNPSTGLWTITGSLSVGRSYFNMLLLANGNVVAFGGRQLVSGTYSCPAAVEEYDPVIGGWTTVAALAVGRYLESATLLTDGTILVAGGSDVSGNPALNGLLFNLGLGFNAGWRPVVTAATTALGSGGNFSASGSGFKGISGGSNGGFQDSPSNYPLVQLRAIDGGQSVFVLSNPAANWSDSSFTSAAVNGFPYGYALATVFTNGIPGVSSIVNVTAPALSSNSNLSNLVLSAGTLSPAFVNGTTSYTALVTDVTSAITVTPTVADNTATVTVNSVPVTSGTASNPISLNFGDKTINTLVTAQDNATTSNYSIVVTRLTNLQTWRLNNFNIYTNSGIAADNYDYDQDGVVNLLEYAFGLNPTLSGSSQLPQPVLSGNTLSISFNQPAGVGGITYGAEWTGSLNPPNWAPLPDTGSGTTHIFSITIDSNPSGFLRLKVTEP